MRQNKKSFPYIHGFSEDEQRRLLRQAEFAEHTVYRDVNFSKSARILEVGSGVGAQSAILLRRFPRIHLTSIEVNEKQIKTAQNYFAQLPLAKDRYEITQMDGANMDFSAHSFDGAFLCWILEHVSDPARVLSEVRRVLRLGSPVFITEVMNSSFFLDPYSPNVWKYWMAFNDYQYDHAGDPFIGAKLGNLLQSQGFRNIETTVKTWHFDNREPESRRDSIRFWRELLLSAADQLLAAKYIEENVISKVKQEFSQVESNPDAVFFYSFMQAKALVA